MIHWLRGSGQHVSIPEHIILGDINALKQMEKIRIEIRKVVSEIKCDRFPSVIPGKYTKDVTAVHGSDLYYAMGSFKIRGMAEGLRSSECDACSVKVRYDWLVTDRYDWHDNLSTNIMGAQIPDYLALELERCDLQHPKPYDMSSYFSDYDRKCVPCKP